MFKSLISQVDLIAGNQIPLDSSINENLTSWSKLHGWDVTDLKYQHILVRQAIINSIARQYVLSHGGSTFLTPLDSLNIEIPSHLFGEVREVIERLNAKLFNVWGEFYNALISQPQRRHLGQFWTDERVAEWMVTWILKSHPTRLVDVGCGSGGFLFKAIQHVIKDNNYTTELYGFDISPLLLNITLANIFTKFRGNLTVLPVLNVQNYLDDRFSLNADAIICNPPYTRHHNIPPIQKDVFQAFFKAQFHLDVSRQGTLAFYFLLKLIAEMPDGASAAVIVPMEVLDARYGKAMKRVLCQHTVLSAIINFSPQMNAFHKVDVGASILFFKKGYDRHDKVRHIRLTTMPTTNELLWTIENESTSNLDLGFGFMTVQPQSDLLEIPKWFSISVTEPNDSLWQNRGLVVPLKALAKVMRGIATGANQFFVLTDDQVKERSLEPYVVRTLHRNREIQDIILDESKWQALREGGKCVWLLYLNGDETINHQPMLSYIREGEGRGYHLRSLVQTRRKWYIMEQREIPDIFFTILTRGNPRFILNRAGVRPVNMFSLIYPNRHITSNGATEILWVLLNSDFSLSRLHSVSRTYGGNTLKVEPRELENLLVINPLALSGDDFQRIRGWIEDFYQHQQASVLMKLINELVASILNKSNIRRISSALPIQLRLLEEDGSY